MLVRFVFIIVTLCLETQKKRKENGKWILVWVKSWMKTDLVRFGIKNVLQVEKR